MIHMNAWQLLTGAVMLLIFSFILEPSRPIHWSNEAILSLLFNGLFSTALTFVIWFWILNQIEATKASMALMFVPVLGLLFGWLQLHEPVTISILIGAFMICIGIFMNTYQFKKV